MLTIKNKIKYFYFNNVRCFAHRIINRKKLNLRQQVKVHFLIVGYQKKKSEYVFEFKNTNYSIKTILI